MIRFNVPTIGRKDLESVLYCMVEDDLLPGARLQEFCTLLKGRLRLNGVTACNNYLSPFEIAMNLIGAEKGDEVLLASFSRPGILKALVKAGMKPVPVDIEEDSVLPSIDAMKKRISPKTRCLFISHMFGIPNDISAFGELGLPIVEDLDGSLGSTVNGVPAGSFGDFVTLNLNDCSIITTGTGGMLGTSKREMRVRLSDAAFGEQLMSDFNAALGISQLVRLDENIKRRGEIGKYYDGAVVASGSSFVDRDENKFFCYSSYVVKTETPFDECERFFKKSGIPVKRGIAKPLHQLLGLDIRDFERTERLYQQVVALPIYPGMKKEEIEEVAKGIRSIL
ncbi:MAG: DegT/DnrJ/EryC1/StrS aminotransferase family protein [Spirochaetes bacterium]|nr:DegT/DnrJ/EryC1/StrS aminotransferase family protein [Spirochaetota bacterium]